MLAVITIEKNVSISLAVFKGQASSCRSGWSIVLLFWLQLLKLDTMLEWGLASSSSPLLSGDLLCPLSGCQGLSHQRVVISVPNPYYLWAAPRANFTRYSERIRKYCQEHVVFGNNLGLCNDSDFFFFDYISNKYSLKIIEKYKNNPKKPQNEQTKTKKTPQVEQKVGWNF